MNLPRRDAWIYLGELSSFFAYCFLFSPFISHLTSHPTPFTWLSVSLSILIVEPFLILYWAFRVFYRHELMEKNFRKYEDSPADVVKRYIKFLRTGKRYKSIPAFILVPGLQLWSLINLNGQLIAIQISCLTYCVIYEMNTVRTQRKSSRL